MRTTYFRTGGGSLAVLAMLASIQTASAAATPSTTQPPGVARISDVGGNVAITRSDSAQTVAARANAPLLTSDALSTGANGRAEVQLDDQTFIRQDSGAQARLAQAGARGNAFQLASGTAELRRFANEPSSAAIDTPSISVRPQAASAFRVSVRDGETFVTPTSGRVELVGAHIDRVIQPGNTFVVRGSAAAPQFTTIATVPNARFDQWVARRDRLEDGYNGFGLANNGLVGVSQLNAYGRWVSTRQYGQVWVPNGVGNTWAPYQNGQWTWEPYYGYTWVGNEPWGWAPYHYGRWFNSSTVPGSGWAWVPGVETTTTTVTSYPAVYNPPPAIYQPGSYYPNGYYSNGYYPNGYYQNGYPGSVTSSLWMPATVAFLDLMAQQNGGASNGLLTGLFAGLLGGYPAAYGNTYPSYYGTAYPANVNVAWVPLAPNEPAYPWWGTWQTAPSWTTTTYTSAPQVTVNNYYRYVTVENVTRIYRNVVVPNAVTVVSARNFAAGRFADRIAFANLRDSLRTIAVVRNALPIMPTAANLRIGAPISGPARPASFAAFPAVARVPAFTAVRPALAETVRKAYQLPETRAQLAAVEQPRPIEQARSIEQPRRPVTPPMIRPRDYAPPPAQRAPRASAPERPYAAPRPVAARPPQQRHVAPAPRAAADAKSGGAQSHHHDEQ
jgi:hypothetical protein